MTEDLVEPKKREEQIMMGFLIAVMVIALVVLGFTMKSMFFDTDLTTSPGGGSSMGKSTSRMSLTSFDRQLAKQLMDKDHNGKCDSCGMPVEMCIDSGEVQCSMDPSSQIGKLGSQHIHADWKIYMNGKELDLSAYAMDMSKSDNKITSSFIHVDAGAPEPEKTSDVIHMHATGVPLWIFFKSIGMDFNQECITLDNQEKICNEGNKTQENQGFSGPRNSIRISRELKFLVNGKENNEFENYVFNDLDKILISYGSENQPEIQKQLASITSFAMNHRKGSAAKASSSSAAEPATPSPIKLPANIQSSTPLKFSSMDEEIEYMKKNAKNPKSISIEKAVRGMDPDHNGVCDSCGMSILGCIESGMESM